MRQRKIKKIGNSYFIALSKIDVLDFGLKVDDIVDIDDLALIQMARTELELTEEEINGAIEIGDIEIGKQETEQDSVLNQKELEENVDDFLLNESAKKNIKKNIKDLDL